MWTTTLCHPFAFVKLSVTMASLPHRNCPSDSQVYIAMGKLHVEGSQARGGWGGDAGVTGKKGSIGGGGQVEGGGERERERAKGRMKEVIYRWWV